MSKGLNRLAIFWGAFDPPQMVDSINLLTMVETAAADEIWVIPTYKKVKCVASYEDRVSMCHGMVSTFRSAKIQVKVSRLDEMAFESGNEFALGNVIKLAFDKRLVQEGGKVILPSNTTDIYTDSEVESLRARGQVDVKIFDFIKEGNERTRLTAYFERGIDAKHMLPRAVNEHILKYGLYKPTEFAIL